MVFFLSFSFLSFFWLWGIALIDPGSMGNAPKRFDARMSPAHARLVQLASEIGGGPPNQGGEGGSGGGGGFTPTMAELPNMDMWLPDDKDDFNFEEELANWDKQTQLRMESNARKAPIGGKWSKAEDLQLKSIVETNGPRNWKKIAELLGPTRSDVQCLHRWNKVLKPGLLKVYFNFFIFFFALCAHIYSTAL